MSRLLHLKEVWIGGECLWVVEKSNEKPKKNRTTRSHLQGAFCKTPEDLYKPLLCGSRQKILKKDTHYRFLARLDAAGAVFLAPIKHMSGGWLCGQPYRDSLRKLPGCFWPINPKTGLLRNQPSETLGPQTWKTIRKPLETQVFWMVFGEKTSTPPPAPGKVSFGIFAPRRSGVARVSVRVLGASESWRRTFWKKKDIQGLQRGAVWRF